MVEMVRKSIHWLTLDDDQISYLQILGKVKIRILDKSRYYFFRFNPTVEMVMQSIQWLTINSSDILSSYFGKREDQISGKVEILLQRCDLRFRSSENPSNGLPWSE